MSLYRLCFLVLAWLPLGAYAIDGKSIALVQKGKEEIHIYTEMSGSDFYCPRQRILLRYEQWLLADADDDLLRPPTMMMVQPREAHAEWSCDGVLAGSWTEGESDPSFLSLTEDFFLEGALPQVGPAMESLDLPHRLEEVAQALSTVMEAGIEGHFRRLPQSLIEGADVYAHFPRILRSVQAESPAEMRWNIGKVEHNSQIIADIDIVVNKMPLEIVDGNLNLPRLSWIPHSELLGEMIEELLSLMGSEDAKLDLTIQAGIHGSWNPSNLLEHSQSLNVTLLFETLVDDEVCKFEIDIHSTLSSVRED